MVLFRTALFPPSGYALHLPGWAPMAPSPSRRGDRATTTTTPPCGWSPSGTNDHALALKGVVIVIGWWAETESRPWF